MFNILNLLSNWMLNSHFILIRLHSFLHTWCATSGVSMRAMANEQHSQLSQRTQPHTYGQWDTNIYIFKWHSIERINLVCGGSILVLKMLMLENFFFFSFWLLLLVLVQRKRPRAFSTSIHSFRFVRAILRETRVGWTLRIKKKKKLQIERFVHDFYWFFLYLFFVLPFRGNAALRACRHCVIGAQTVFSYILIDRYRIL